MISLKLGSVPTKKKIEKLLVEPVIWNGKTNMLVRYVYGHWIKVLVNVLHTYIHTDTGLMKQLTDGNKRASHD